MLENDPLQQALKDPKWVNHKLNQEYSMKNADSTMQNGWKITYYPLFGTYKGGIWFDFDEPRALVERKIEGGFDFREIPIRFLIEH